MLECKAYQTYYAFASGEKTPKLKLKSNKKKQPAKKPKAKGLAVLSEAALTEAQKLKLATKRSKNDFHISHASGLDDGVNTQSKVLDEQQQKTSGTDEGTGTIQRVLDVPIYDCESDKESWGDSDEEDDDENDFKDDADNNDDDSDDNDESDDERTKSDRYEIPDPNKTNAEHDEEEGEYDDVFNIEEDEKIDKEEDNEVTKELYKDVNVNLGNKDADITYKTRGSTQSSSVSSDFTSKLLNLDNPSPTDTMISSLMDTIVHHEITSATTVPPPPSFFNPLQQEATPTSTTTFEATTTFTSLLDFASVFKFNERVTNLEKYLSEIKQVDQYAQALYSIPAIVDRYMDNKLGEAINKAIQAHNFDCREEAQAKKREYIELVDSKVRTIIKEKVNAQLPHILPQAISDVATSVIEKNITESLEAALFASEEESRRQRQRSRPLRWIRPRDERRKSSKYVECSKDSKSNEKKSSSTSKDTSQSQHKSFGKSAHVEEPSHTVEDLGMQQNQEFVTGDNDKQPADKEVTKADWFKNPEQPPTLDPDWKIEVRRDDPQLYTFKKGNFKRLRPQEIEDMLLLLVQQKLTNLTIDERYDLNMALCMYTRRIVIQRRVEDLQLGIESYQKKLNLTKPDTYRSNLRNKTAYTSYSDPYGIIYEDQFKRKRLMRTDELHKFSDDTLNDVWIAYDIAAGIRMEYLPMRKWSNLDKKRAQVMVQDIDKQLYQRRLLRNLEKFVGGRIYGNDLRLLERTI
uniref:Uncharacterized protein n=1 Tax=Tanacetum cinerariifolium TaxID=118510 RepID=A0A6L2MCG7_TANCI|nr:hypothetical protein [Tanacetum cinerariifolium]